MPYFIFNYIVEAPNTCKNKYDGIERITHQQGGNFVELLPSSYFINSKKFLKRNASDQANVKANYAMNLNTCLADKMTL